jgi:hypothetical protein
VQWGLPRKGFEDHEHGAGLRLLRRKVRAGEKDYGAKPGAAGPMPEALWGHKEQPSAARFRNKRAALGCTFMAPREGSSSDARDVVLRCAKKCGLLSRSKRRLSSLTQSSEHVP